MKKKKRESEKAPHNSLPDPLPVYEARTTDRRDLLKAGETLQPYLIDLIRSSRRWRFEEPEIVMTRKFRKRVRDGLFAEKKPLAKMFSDFAGRKVTGEEVDTLLMAAADEWETRFTETLSQRRDEPNLASHNLLVDGTYQLAGGQLLYQPLSGQGVVFNVTSETEQAAGAAIMTCLFILEMIALVFTLVGLALPVPPAAGVADDVAETFAQPRIRRILKRVLDAVTDPSKSTAEKLTEILDLAQAIYGAGLLGAIVKKAFDDLPWWRKAMLAALFVAQLIAIFVPGGAATLAAKKAITVGQGIASLTAKAWELADVLEAETG